MEGNEKGITLLIENLCINKRYERHWRRLQLLNPAAEKPFPVIVRNQRWEFIKENKKTHFRPRKRSRKNEKKKENTLSTMKAIKEKR